MTTQARNQARVIPLRPAATEPAPPVAPAARAFRLDQRGAAPPGTHSRRTPASPEYVQYEGDPGARREHAPADATYSTLNQTKGPREPLWRDVVGEVLRRERLAQGRTLKDVSEAARISMPYLSELERGRKEASSEVLAAAAQALGFGLAELLTRVRDDLVTPTEPTRPTSTVSHLAPATSTTGRGATSGRGEVRLAA